MALRCDHLLECFPVGPGPAIFPVAMRTQLAMRQSATDLGASSSWPYAATIFLSAFLLFQVQLIIGKYFLPWFGGTPAMWTTCMFFFQTVLVVGYLYAHLLAHRVNFRWQA